MYMSVIVRVHIIKLYAEINVNLFRSKEFEMRFNKVFIKKKLTGFYVPIDLLHGF